jgi:RNA-directed DNA polymerase
MPGPFGRGVSLSGVTPGEREELADPSRDRGLRSRADQITPCATSWSAPLQHLRPNPHFLLALARAILAGEPRPSAIADRLRESLGHDWRWIKGLAKRYEQKFARDTRPRAKTVVEFLSSDAGFNGAFARSKIKPVIVNRFSSPALMLPVRAASDWQVPAIETEGTLAAWLRATPEELEWFADLKRFGARSREEKLRHYSYRVLVKPGGSLRLIEAPKQRLKQMQRQILTAILERIPAHHAAHGFQKGRSIKTFAAAHTGQRLVLRMDLRDFFPSIRSARVQALFRTAGYPERVADLLGGICTTATPRDVFSARPISIPEFTIDPNALFHAWQTYAYPHLPQGAPTSPALANLCAYRADCRLSGLARAAGATYTRYADDLAFSGGENFERCVERFAIHAAAILLEEGFEVNHRKTRVMRRSVRQYLAGVVANEHVNVVRADFDRLKATLTNCVRHGPATQNREGQPNFRAHLAGRISFVEMLNPRKGARLKKIFEQIVWPQGE